VRQRTDPNYKPPAEEVIALTEATFEEKTSSHPLVLVEFYAPWSRVLSSSCIGFSSGVGIARNSLRNWRKPRDD
jgi:hypothetical protein